MVRFNSKIVSLFFILFWNVPGHKASKDDNDYDKIMRTPNDFLKKYAVNSDKMTSDELGLFLKRFANSLANYSRLNSHSIKDCIELKLNKFGNLTNDENRKNVLIDETKLEEISSFIVANLDWCLNKNYQQKDNQMENVRPKPSVFNHTKEGRENNIHSLKIDSIENLNAFILVWLYSTLSVITISAVGLFCVAIVPVLNLFFFEYLFQLLTALALGALCGDAFFHLLPHVSSHLFLVKFTIIIFKKNFN
jgi:hypothetical protein